MALKPRFLDGPNRKSTTRGVVLWTRPWDSAPEVSTQFLTMITDTALSWSRHQVYPRMRCLRLSRAVDGPVVWPRARAGPVELPEPTLHNNNNYNIRVLYNSMIRKLSLRIVSYVISWPRLKNMYPDIWGIFALACIICCRTSAGLSLVKILASASDSELSIVLLQKCQS